MVGGLAAEQASRVLEEERLVGGWVGWEVSLRERKYRG